MRPTAAALRAVDAGRILITEETSTPHERFATGVFVLGGIALVAAAAWGTGINHDEGWYLYAARRLSEGLLPYRDFLFTQGPLTPLWYLPSQALTGGSLWAGRITSAVALLIAMLLAERIVRRSSPLGSIWLLLALVCTPIAISQAVIAKTGGVVALCWMVAISLWRKRPAVAIVMMILATGCRVSMAPAVAVLMGARLIVLLREGRHRAALRLVFGTSALGAVIFGVPLLLDAQNTWFGWFTFHQLGSTSIEAYFPRRLTILADVALWMTTPLALCIVAVAARALRKAPPDEKPGLLGVGTVDVALAVTVIAQLLPYRAQSNYLAPLLLPAMTLALLQLGRLRSSGTIAIAACLLVGAWPLPKTVRSIWSPADSADGRVAPITAVRVAAAAVEAQAAPTDVLFTFSVGIALESNLPLHPGLEMGIFSYTPSFNTHDATRLHTLNDQQISKLFRSGVPDIVVVQDRHFRVRSPEIMIQPESANVAFRALLTDHYRVAGETPPFGQWVEPATIYARRNAARKQP